MTTYTINDVAHIIPVDQTPTATAAIENYINNGVVPPYDPCLSCEPNHIRKLISLIQVAERNGLWPPKRETVKKPATTRKPKAAKVKDEPHTYVAGEISEAELEEIKQKRPEMFKEDE